ncbi:Pentapeptide repeats (8 copies) [Planctomycetes bacterium Poly30]|uniref:Pentapeptide repeats (8 copies) n=1 Tax=Saltatorellus ferox TaxID=2528018 RepID=A0A518EQY8_9BACT|nr:Pentapeptide repeats (8 copies) [Planctomycetes bacterium Poly30]
MDTTNFATMPAAPPSELTAPSLLATMLRAAGFRYHWATADLPAEALPFRPSPGSMSLQELLHHMHRLAWWLEGTFADRAPQPRPDSAFADMRTATLNSLAAAAVAVLETPSSALASTTVRRGPDAPASPFWSVLHGPLADFLTHVGQVTSWRRIQGSPAPAARYFEGLGPDSAAAAPVATSSSGPTPTRFQSQDLAESVFHDVALTGADFNDVSLAGAKFTNVTFAGATLKDVDLSNVNITDANIEGLRIDGELVSG